MAKFLPPFPSIEVNAAYIRLRVILAFIVRLLSLMPGEMYKFMHSTPCEIMSFKLCEHYFHRSRLLAIYKDMVLLFQALLVMAPRLQYYKNSMGFDWHHGNVLGWFRTNTRSNMGRCYFACDEVARDIDVTKLWDAMRSLRIDDHKYIHVLEQLFRCYYGRQSVTGKLANTLFDPIMLHRMGSDSTLRVGNKIFRLEKQGFPGSIDLRQQSATVLMYRIKRIEHRVKGRTTGHLEITITDEHMKVFCKRCRRIIRSGMSPKFKVLVLKRRIVAFAYSVRYARHGFEQIVELSRWLDRNLKPLYGAVDAYHKKRKSIDADLEQVFRLSKVLVNTFLHINDTTLYHRRPNFFYDAKMHDEQTFLAFFSPYREEG